ncbi:MAG: thiamine phosphate synthase [Actinomycetota bacterium]
MGECRLYLVTDARSAAGDLDRFLAEVLDAGVGMVQLREKQMEAGPLLRYAEVVRRRTAAAGALFIVNDRVDVAIAAGADGVHLGQQDLPLDEARRQVGPELIVGVSTHSVDQLESATASTADYCAIGPVFATPTKPGRPAVGLDLVRAAAKRATKPVFAIGGINASNVRSVLDAGAGRVSVVRALTQSDDPAGEARKLTAALGQLD